MSPRSDTAATIEPTGPDAVAGILPAADFEKVRALIYRLAGISLMDSKRMMAHARLSRRLSALGIPTFAQYLARVESDTGGEQQAFINALTTNLTSFYREQYHFPVLEQQLRSLPGTGDVQIWCGAASTGEEPYSIAMTAARALGQRRRFRLLATDIDTGVLETARRGVYPIEAIEPVPATDRRAYLMRGSGATEGKVRVRPELAANVQFAQFNLVAPQWRLDRVFDIVFLRNVLIYFDAQTRMEIMRRMHAVMHPQSLLFIGHSESFGDTGGLFRLEGRTVYRRLGEPVAERSR